MADKQDISIHEQANNYKNEGNKLFLEGHYEKSVELYSKAIELLADDDKAVVPILCN